MNAKAMEIPAGGKIDTHGRGGMSVSGTGAMMIYRAVTVKQAISLWVKCKMMVTRGATITKMLGIAGEFTGKTYKRSQCEMAITDLENWIAEAKKGVSFNGQPPENKVE